MLSQELRAASQIVALVGLVFSFLMLIPWMASVFTGCQVENLSCGLV